MLIPVEFSIGTKPRKCFLTEILDSYLYYLINTKRSIIVICSVWLKSEGQSKIIL